MEEIKEMFLKASHFTVTLSCSFGSCTMNCEELKPINFHEPVAFGWEVKIGKESYGSYILFRGEVTVEQQQEVISLFKETALETVLLLIGHQRG